MAKTVQTERILLVDDSKALSKLIMLKVKNELGLEIDIAYSLAEAELFTKKYTYTLSIIDLNLPDAPHGEIVDAMLKKHIPAIVLTGSVDKEFRKEILKKDIIDYVHKGGLDDIDYVIDIIKRLLKNRAHKVMVVDDSSIFRNQMKKMVENLFFRVYALAHGEEALLIMEQNPDIKIIITDYNMPVMDGLELTKAVRKRYTKNQLSVFVLSSTEDLEVSAMLLKHGANDFINKPFSKEEFSCRLNNAIEALENIDALTNYSKRDFLTGLYNQRYFMTLMENRFTGSRAEEEFVTAVIEIDDEKYLYETYGEEIGNGIVIQTSEVIRSCIDYRDLFGRFETGEFILVLVDHTRESAMELLEHIRQKISVIPFSIGEEEVALSVSIGAVFHPEDTLNDTINEADSALVQAKASGGNTLYVA
ncbi:MAG: response regulator [Sulfuricurvum sp.]|jgi:diguanylate cyclase (GGDEF)-like protein|uniref:GGDEF domain-containing response regulator n=1 Tax=Sulfuricurvum sp. TaxID=2025608 RepID=UPI0025FED44A|nr:response regulator [Sulfuricurvum sp.]MCI4406972.1 response regulator [Sulfuricurvum sp.]